ncbi:MAG: aconitate hydratase [Brevibacterium aurantiacum]|uniref:Aconitase n=2 Tax=Brevibacterium aurantiacum TaxID=273384 RepID=A0A2A3ZNG9_BREAU|nr:aconitate hydratase [Brevibacterium aurantiacum]MDN5550787.1 aconitate hydratase [Brevibacterium sp.]AZL04776.1 aconitate hydratase [Brevibacterium aurantiacum]AZL08360.1 aconitate hydratase [Brevibacterium aurantiacum]AZL11963.1 aconitate hydratase [Brevibacterium aurantiacum]AZT96192.1 aconitate hydratase [Brevibacterium aurantiacum]
MAENVAQKLISSHLESGTMTPGNEIGVRIDQTLTQDATGTLVALELEALGLDRIRTDTSVQYVDHNLLQTDEKNPEDHMFLRSAAQRFGLWFSPAGNGVSHPVHQSRFGKPGATLIGSDSHTCAAGALGMLAIGVGGLEVAMAMAGDPLYIAAPQVMGVELTGELPPWVSAKDVILEMLRRHGVKGGAGKIIEYHGEGLRGLSAMDRHVIANMGAELGATATVFPADDAVREFLEASDRGEDFTRIVADEGAEYDLTDSIDLSALEPLIAAPSSPGNVRPVRECTDEEVFQVVIGSSANPGLRDFAVVSQILEGRQVHGQVSLDVNPTSREILADLIAGGWLTSLVGSGARIHQSGCMGCIGMGQAPAVGRNSLRTMPRNFPGRSGTDEDAVWLCSPETAAAAALTGRITDPRDLDMDYPQVRLPEKFSANRSMLVPPLPVEEAREVELVKGSNISSLPDFEPLPEDIDLEILLKVGDNVSTDEIMPAGSRVLPYRSNIPKISEFVYIQVDDTYATRAAAHDGGHAIVGGENYGQGSSREHAVIAPRYLGLRIVIAKSLARIHWQNLANFGVLALEFATEDDYETLSQGDVLEFRGLRDQLGAGETISAEAGGRSFEFRHTLSPRQIDMVLAGGRIAQRAQQEAERKS